MAGRHKSVQGRSPLLPGRRAHPRCHRPSLRRHHPRHARERDLVCRRHDGEHRQHPAHWRRRVTGKCLTEIPVTASRPAPSLFSGSSSNLHVACADVDVVFIRLLEHRTSKIYVLAVATVLPNHRLTGYALCAPILGQFRAWVGFFGRLRRRRFHLPSRSANFPVGTFVYLHAEGAGDAADSIVAGPEFVRLCLLGVTQRRRYYTF
eukprot:scaffold22748_cov120-Isochrysis_galbana.AAC.3